MKYILMNIGCIECDVSSKIVAVLNDKEIAEKLADHLNDKADWREGGQNDYKVFEMPKLNTIDSEYKEYLQDKLCEPFMDKLGWEK